MSDTHGALYRHLQRQLLVNVSFPAGYVLLLSLKYASITSTSLLEMDHVLRAAKPPCSAKSIVSNFWHSPRNQSIDQGRSLSFLRFQPHHISRSPYPSHDPTYHTQVATSLSDRTFQTLKSEDGSPLTRLRCQACAETGERYILWSKVQQAFKGTNHLWYLETYNQAHSLALFMIERDGDLYVELFRND